MQQVSVTNVLRPGDKIRVKPETYKAGSFTPRNNMHGTVIRQKDYSRAYIIELTMKGPETEIVELFADEVFRIEQVATEPNSVSSGGDQK